MKSRTISLALAAGLFGLALWLAFKPKPEPPAQPVSIPQGAEPVVVIPPTSQATPQAKVSPVPFVLPVTSASPAAMLATPPLPSTTPAGAPQITTAEGGDGGPRDARIDEGKVRLMLRDYHTLTGGNPVGTNAEIMRAIMGGNLKQATLGPPEGMSLNGDGELVDQWGSPYFFHQISSDLTEIRSAGPDKRLYTADDVVTR